MLFNKALKKDGEEELESENNNELTEQDYIQINKDISKALFDMKKEGDKDEDPDESIEENERELTNFDMDFFSESSNSISMDNNSDISENSFRSANLEMNRNNLSFEIHNKNKDTIKHNINNTNNNNVLNGFLGNNKFSNKSKNSSNTSIISEPEKKIIYNRTSSFPFMENDRKSSGFSSKVDNLNNSFNCSPYYNNFNNSLFNNYHIKLKHINNDIKNDNNNNNNFFKKNMNNFINNNINNNDLNSQDKSQSNINNINFINNNIEDPNPIQPLNENNIKGNSLNQGLFSDLNPVPLQNHKKNENLDFKGP